MHSNGGNTAPLAPETTTFLEMTSPRQLRRRKVAELSVAQVPAEQWEVARGLYIDVGASWQWIDRLAWSADRWRNRFAQPGVELWTGLVGGQVVGYFELDAGNGATELAYFGLRSDFFGRGLGGALLTLAVERAWDTGSGRVWVHTSDRDHPAALTNYLARGFRIYARQRVLSPVVTAP